MTTLPPYADRHLVADRRQRSITNTELSRRVLRIDMQTQDRINPLQPTLLDKPLGALANLLCRLKQVSQIHPAPRFQLDIVGLSGHGPRDAQHDRRMNIVTTGMHHAVTTRTVLDRLGILDLQRVDVRPQSHACRVGPGISDHRISHQSQPVAKHRCRHTDLVQPLSQVRGRLTFPAAGFRMHVQVPADANQFLAMSLQPGIYRLTRRPGHLTNLVGQQRVDGEVGRLVHCEMPCGEAILPSPIADTLHVHDPIGRPLAGMQLDDRVGDHFKGALVRFVVEPRDVSTEQDILE